MIKVILPFFRSSESKMYAENKFRIMRSFRKNNVDLKNVAFCAKANPLFSVDEKQWAKISDTTHLVRKQKTHFNFFVCILSESISKIK
jgi:hypothetical protein